MQAVLKQACTHLLSSTPLVIHVNSKSPVQDLEDWTAATRALVRANGSAPILANPKRLRVHRARGTILLGHILNFRLAVAQLPPFQRFILLANNVVLFRAGLEAWAMSRHMTFSIGWELPSADSHRPTSATNVVVMQTDEMGVRLGQLAVNLSRGIAPDALDWPDAAEAIGENPRGAMRPMVGALRTMECKSPSTRLCATSSDHIWARVCPPHDRILAVPMSHEGSFYPTRIMAAFDDFLRRFKLDLELEHLVGACEEYWISTWLLAWAPYHILCGSPNWVPPSVYRIRGQLTMGSGSLKSAIAILIRRVRATANSFVFGYKVVRRKSILGVLPDS